MDPITATVVGGVLWFFLGSLGTVLIYFTASIFAFSAKGFKAGVVAGVVGWVLAACWQIFVIVQVVLHVVRLIQLIGEGV